MLVHKAADRAWLATSDYLFTGPGEEHGVVAVTDAQIFVSLQRGNSGATAKTPAFAAARRDPDRPGIPAAARDPAPGSFAGHVAPAQATPGEMA